MLSIKKTGEGYYLASLTGHNVDLGKSECQLIKKEIMAVLKPHREITINIKGVKNIENGGLTILHELKIVADASKCKLRFIHAEPQLAAKISRFTERKIQPQKEPEI